MDKTNPVSRNVWRKVTLAILCAGLLPLGGCRICAECEDLSYPAYGGAWQRTQREQGRVGSLFDPGGAKASSLVARDTPSDIDELERERQKARGKSALDGDPDEMDSPEPEREEERDREMELRDRELDDIEEGKENELREKNLDDININVVPGQPMPPVLR